MQSIPSSSETKREVLRTLLLEGHQACKIVVDPSELGAEEHGLPGTVIDAYPEGIPLDLDPSWPLELDLDGDIENVAVSLSFSARVCRCQIPWRAISMIAAGLGSAGWAHEAEESDPEDPGPEPGTRVGHLRVLK